MAKRLSMSALAQMIGRPGSDEYCLELSTGNLAIGDPVTDSGGAIELAAASCFVRFVELPAYRGGGDDDDDENFDDEDEATLGIRVRTTRVQVAALEPATAFYARL